MNQPYQRCEISRHQWQGHTRACQIKWPAEVYIRPAALVVKSRNSKILYQDNLTALADATNDLPKPCHEQRLSPLVVVTRHISSMVGV